jgi:hypothetical protein
LLPFVGVAVLLAVWSLTVWVPGGRSGVAAVTDRDVPRDVDRDEQRERRFVHWSGK